MQNNIVGWFEIPVTDMNRAIKFYEGVFNIKLERNKMESVDMAWFPHHPEKYGSGGTLICHKDFYKPSSEGIMIYLSAPSGDLANELGDVLLQIILHAQIASEAGTFKMKDIIHNINQKIIRRHPHVFGNIEVSSSDEVYSVMNRFPPGEKDQGSRG